jgi:hypothetical protein
MLIPSNVRIERDRDVEELKLYGYRCSNLALELNMSIRIIKRTIPSSKIEQHLKV